MEIIRPFNPKSVPKPKRGSVPLFNKGFPLSLEIGAGTGMHAFQYAQQHPERHLIAIEQTHTKFGKFQRSYEKHPQNNLSPIQADARNWVAHYLEDNSLLEAFILYPNPNPKEKLKNQRWHYMPFMHHLLKVIQPGGHLTLATNELWYFEEAQKAFEDLWKVKVIEAQEIQNDRAPRTLFEKKFFERGEKCYNLMLEI